MMGWRNCSDGPHIFPIGLFTRAKLYDQNANFIRAKNMWFKCLFHYNYGIHSLFVYWSNSVVLKKREMRVDVFYVLNTSLFYLCFTYDKNHHSIESEMFENPIYSISQIPRDRKRYYCGSCLNWNICALTGSTRAIGACSVSIYNAESTW